MQEFNINISQRLMKVGKYLPKGARFADIGSDHAYLPCYICMQDHSASAIAGEVNNGPFESAKKNVEKFGLDKQITVRLGNGLEVIQETDNIEQLVIAGMGGGLIVQILEEGKEKLKTIKRMILQPNVDARKVRFWLRENGFILSNEEIMEEHGHIYEILVADRKGNDPYVAEQLEQQYLFGPFLLQSKTPVFYKKWREEKGKLERVINQMMQATNPNEEKIAQFREELSWMKEVIKGE